MIRKRIAGIVLSIAVAASAFGGMAPVPAAAAVGYLDNVTEAMSRPVYWSDKMQEPEKVLADEAAIKKMNETIRNESATNLTDLSAWTKTTFDGVAMAQNLQKAAESDAFYLYGQGSRYDQNGVKHVADSAKGITKEDAIAAVYGDMIANCVDKSATTEMPVRYAIVTTRTTLLTFPTDGHLYDDPTDPDFDNLYQTALRVNEPLIIQAKSGDGKYYYAVSECSPGWVSAEDIAFCEDRNEWLDAWQFDAEDTLVVCTDRITTETSAYAPEVSKRSLTMGTTLELADKSDWTDLIINRSAHNNHVVWMPVRKDDGSYEKKLALISEHCKVSEGFMPLTSKNLSKVALNFLGNCYGWGGMLDSEDCSGYVRDVYRCFGLNLARNTTWQALQPVKKYTMEVIATDAKAEEKAQKRAEKTAIIQSLPVGSVLIFSGHEMIYLGCENEKLYVISAVSKLVPESETAVKRIRNTVINTLDVRRANGMSWLDALTTAEVPYLPADAADDFGVKTGEEEPETDPAQALAEAEKSVKELQTQLAEKEEELQTQLAEKEEELAKQEEKLAEKETELTKIEAELIQAKEEAADSEQIRTLTKEVTKTETALKQMQKQKTALEKEVKQLKQAQNTLLQKAVIKTVKAGKKTLKITWKKQKDVSGYTIEIAANKNFTRNKKTITIKKASVTKKTIKKLKSKKKYYLRVRAYKKSGSGELSGSWSKIKTKKTK